MHLVFFLQPVAFVTFLERENAEECKSELQVSRFLMAVVASRGKGEVISFDQIFQIFDFFR